MKTFVESCNQAHYKCLQSLISHQVRKQVLTIFFSFVTTRETTKRVVLTLEPKLIIHNLKTSDKTEKAQKIDKKSPITQTHAKRTD